MRKILAIFTATLTVMAFSVVVTSGRLQAESVSYTPGITPIFTSKPNSAGYGGIGLPFGDSVFDGSGYLNITVFYPDAAEVKDYGKLYAGLGYIPSPPFLVHNVERTCQKVEGGTNCTFRRPTQITLMWNEISNVPHYVEYTDKHGAIKRVVNTSEGSPTDSLTIRLKPELAYPGAAIFETQGETITDPSLETKEIAILTRTDTNVDHIKIDIDGAVYTLNDFTVVVDDRFFGGKARRYVYQWDIASLPAGKKAVRANVYGKDGKHFTVHPSVNDNGFQFYITLAVGVNQRLLEQCKQHQSAVQSLISSINSDALSDQQRLDELYTQILEFRGKQNIQSDELDGLEGQLIEQSQTYAESTEQLTQLNVGCQVSLADDVMTYKKAYEKQAADSSAFSGTLIQYAEKVLEEL